MSCEISDINLQKLGDSKEEKNFNIQSICIGIGIVDMIYFSAVINSNERLNIKNIHKNLPHAARILWIEWNISNANSTQAAFKQMVNA